jgi:thioredoxin reductase (NADPH)
MLYAAAIGLILVVFVLPAYLAFRKEERLALAELEKAEKAGRREPVSIRPWVDAGKCMGSGMCVTACPEHRVLSVIDGQAKLVNASLCVGHGACVRACPTKALELVFGSEKRGVHIPNVGADFQSNVEGMYIAGELGGMGLIANAVTQGIQAVGQLMRGRPATPEGGVDLVVVGGGPAGIAAGLQAQSKGLSVTILEQGEGGGAVRHYPRNKIVMSRPFRLPGREKIGGTLSKEELIDELTAASSGLDLREGVRVDGVEKQADGTFHIKTSTGPLRASRVLLAVGRRGTPRKLGCGGEERNKVAYRLLEPDYYAHQHVLVVGGGDSAVEAAVSLGEVDGSRVTLSYRKAQLTRPKEANQRRLAEAVDAGRVNLVLDSTVGEIGEDRVTLQTPDGPDVLPNDQVFVFAGGVLPTALLKDAGIRLQQHFGKRIEDG